MVVPRAMVSTDGTLRKRSSASSEPRRMTLRWRLGTSRPRVERPGRRSMRTDSALSASARSSCRLTMWLTLTPGAGWNSKTVITGPGLIASIVPSTPNSAQRLRIVSPRRTSSASSAALRPSPICSRLTGGSVPGGAAPANGSGGCRPGGGWGGGRRGRSGKRDVLAPLLFLLLLDHALQVLGDHPAARALLLAPFPAAGPREDEILPQQPQAETPGGEQLAEGRLHHQRGADGDRRGHPQQPAGEAQALLH